MARKSRLDEAETLGSLLLAAYEAMIDEAHSQLLARGFADIRPSHNSVLRFVSPDGSSVSSLARRAGLTKQSMKYLVDQLVAADYLTISDDPADARATLVRLTARGRAVSCAAVEISSAIETRWREQLGVDTPELRSILKSLKQALGGSDA